MPKARVAVLISGRGTNMAALVYASRAEDCPYEVVLVSGDRPDAEGLALAEAEGVPVTRLPTPTKATRDQFYRDLDAALRDSGAHYVVLAGLMRILPDAFVEGWAGRMINIHPSLLPKYRGLGTYQAALDAGDSVAGCTVHLVTPELDAGPVLGQTEVAILPGDTIDTLSNRVRIAEHQLLPRTLADYVTRERDPAWIKARIGEIALTLPETRFKTSHGSPGWKVGSPSSDKFFAILWQRHHGEDSIGVLVKCGGQDEMAQLIDADPDLYFRPQYYGPSDWIGIRLDRAGVDWGHVGEWIERSWRVCAPARLTRLMKAADEF
ncbi:phosphoribosylglycinamide formyltransferase [Sphingomonas sp. RB1R13]|uniref:phosphoribosylglycinamide formyltransferase n=1 Tax=Sphingomonas sp. RB1R13 TaxID=3096159 RepID=UPI002FC68293